MRQFTSRKRPLSALLTAILFVSSVGILAVRADTGSNDTTSGTSTPIKHLVVLYQENVSFDHYFATYPLASNPSGEPSFQADNGTPSVNGLTGALLSNNPNLSNPQRLDRSQSLTCDLNHGYTPEQKAFDSGAMDKFVEFASNSTSKTVLQCTGTNSGTSPNYAVMDYYDGNTVTALWNYAQQFAMSDNSYSTGFGPSTPGALEVTTGNTFGTVCGPASAVYGVPACPAGVGASGPAVAQGPGTTYSDADPYYDKCSNQTRPTIAMGGANVGDLLNSAGVSWGWFQGGFSNPGYVPGNLSSFNASAVCTGTHQNIGGATVTDYIPHHQPFQYFPQTSNPQHLPPTSVAMIGHQDQANHQYDLADFWDSRYAALGFTAALALEVVSQAAPGSRNGTYRVVPPASSAPHRRWSTWQIEIFFPVIPSENQKRLEARIAAAAESALAARKVVSAIDVLQGIGWLQQSGLEAWRRGQVPYLERSISANLHKISTAMKIFRSWAQGRGLKPSETAYIARTRDRRRLRFTKSGDENIERAYRTHWISPELSIAKRDRLRERESRASDLVVIQPLNQEWKCTECGSSGSMLIMDGNGPLCLACADLDHLAFLPAGNTALSRRARQASGLSAVVVRFSRARKRYERQGILVEGEALQRAEAECLADEDARAARRIRDQERRDQQDSACAKALGAEIRPDVVGHPA